MNYKNDDAGPSRKVIAKRMAGVNPTECPKRAKAVDEILERLDSVPVVGKEGGHGCMVQGRGRQKK